MVRAPMKGVCMAGAGGTEAGAWAGEEGGGCGI